MEKKIFLFLAVIIILSSYCYAEIGIGFGYPYLAVKYNLSPIYSVELKYANSDGINLVAGRGYKIFYGLDKLQLFAGSEMGYIEFMTLGMKGMGYEGSLFVGGEYFVTKNISVMLDFSPTFIFMKSDNSEVGGFEWIANFCVYYYLDTKLKGESRSGN